MENAIKMDDLGVPQLQETPIKIGFEKMILPGGGSQVLGDTPRPQEASKRTDMLALATQVDQEHWSVIGCLSCIYLYSNKCYGQWIKKHPSHSAKHCQLQPQDAEAW